MYNIPDRFNDMSASDVLEMLKSPEKYQLTFKEYVLAMDSIAEIQRKASGADELNCKIATLTADNKRLKEENAHLKATNSELLSIYTRMNGGDCDD